ncbi:hypothetical protein Scani_30850 [Streptomyces caniferus]|uniref:Uncharacterized protein n=1 Tax=Streptomyces caniferus TaxID=285557 RepID=A0A640S6Y9_9ACTN|nr:hypothetical protein Scani_30850 [Streptomyces caniferus]
MSDPQRKRAPSRKGRGLKAPGSNKGATFGYRPAPTRGAQLIGAGDHGNTHSIHHAITQRVTRVP